MVCVKCSFFISTVSECLSKLRAKTAHTLTLYFTNVLLKYFCHTNMADVIIIPLCILDGYVCCREHRGPERQFNVCVY